MNILLTGASGFIGTQLVNALKESHQLTILSRSVEAAEKRLGASHQYLASLDKLTHLNDFDAVINLAGEPIAGNAGAIAKSKLSAKAAGTLPVN